MTKEAWIAAFVAALLAKNVAISADYPTSFTYQQLPV
jgi:hypothetical protein